VLEATDATGQGAYSRSPETLIKGYTPKMLGNLALDAQFTLITPFTVVLD
jgi:hypothetical protein